MSEGNPTAVATPHIGLVSREEELRGILELQRLNLARGLSSEEVASQGFVTVTHTLPVLQRLHALAPSVIATLQDRVVGYALVMTRAARAEVPILEPMFRELETLRFRGRPLVEQSFYAMGQVCVARAQRGQGVFDALYAGHREHYQARFECVVTEVATRNLRSLRAHARVGFETLAHYRDAEDEWAVLAWGW